MSTHRKTFLGGTFDRKERWGLAWRGWLLLASILLGLGIFLFFGVHSFLAPTQRVPARLLVIEGWSPPITMKQAAAEFRSGGYEQVVLIRPVLDLGDKYESGRYSADWMARLVVRDGIPDDKLTTLCPDVAHKDRTYHSALAIKEWMEKEHLSVKSLDVATEGAHARRSWLLYETAFGPDVKIGIIAMQTPVYDPQHWWRTSEGVREVIGESIAYVYAKFLFWPGKENNQIRKSEI